MSDVRLWIERKLEDRGYPSARLPGMRLTIERSDYPDAEALCIGTSNGAPLGRDELDQALAESPDSTFVVVVPTGGILNSAYARAEELGICVAGFGELLDALENDADISMHVDTQENYERRRLIHNREVISLTRKGQHAYEIERRSLPPITIVTTNSYEFTVDHLYSILEDYEELAINLVVVTNPNCRGFSNDSLTAARQAGIPIVLFEDLLEGIDLPWTN